MKNRYAVSHLNRIEKVFNKLKRFLPKSYHEIQLGAVFSKSKSYATYQGGYATLSTINIGTEFLNKYTDEISMAEMLAHELGHHVMGHIHVGFHRQVTPQEEQDADHFGMFLCELAGYARSEYLTWFKQFEDDRAKTLSKKHQQEHGTGSERLARLALQDKYLTNIDNF